MSERRDQHESRTRERAEPTLGNLDQIDTHIDVHAGEPATSGEPPRKQAPPGSHGQRRRWIVPAIIIALLVVIGGMWVEQNHLRNLLPRTELNDVLGRAQQALAAGHLDGNDGTSARELFQAAIALEPDNDAARNGLHQVGMAELAQADAALQAGQLDVATQKATEARELLGGGSDVDRLDQMIAAQRNGQVKVSTLVQQAQQAFTAGQYGGEDGAGALYRRVLQASPGNAVASHGLDQVGTALADQARQSLAANDTTGADAAIEQLSSLQPNNAALPGLRAARAQAGQQDNAALDNALQQGDAALRAGRIDGSGDDTALAHYKAALALSPGNEQATAGLGKVGQALTVQANAAMDAGDFTQAAALLARAQPLAPKSAEIAEARARLQGHAAGAAPHAAPPSPPASGRLPTASIGAQGVAAAVTGNADGTVQPTLSPQQSAQLARLLQQAQAAVARGDIMMPPGNCAYDLYRNALAIDGNNATARQGLQNLPQVVQQRLEHDLAAGNLADADAMLDNLGDLAPGNPALPALRQRLASAWMDQAEQQLGQGNTTGAGQALDHARRLAPNQPRVQQLTARLQSGV